MTAYSVEYFNQQVCEFIDLCGKRSFWEGAEKVRDNAVKALGYVLLRTEGAEAWRFEAAIVNYARREALCCRLVAQAERTEGDDVE